MEKMIDIAIGVVLIFYSLFLFFTGYASGRARLKADMVAMLEDLDLQIDESAAYNLEVAKVQRLIRDRINKLNEGKE